MPRPKPKRTTGRTRKPDALSRLENKKYYAASKLRELDAKLADRSIDSDERHELEKKRRKYERNHAKSVELVKKLKGEDKNSVVEQGENDEPLQFEDHDPNKDDVIFRPNPGPQEEFLMAPEKEVLMGGAAGGGKSFSLLVEAMRYAAEPEHRALILRRTTDELRELIQKSQELYPKAFPQAKWHEKKSEWVFPSGARIWLTYLDRDDDVYRYQGQSFTFIAFDELTQWPTPFPWQYLSSRLRTVSSNIKTYQRASTNPGGPGHLWVKKMFVDPAPPGEPFWATDVETGKTLVYPPGHAMEGKPLFKRKFIPAKLSDNPYLFEDGDYERQLLSLNETKRKQLLEGNWDIAEGAAFTEWNREYHVIEPFQIPREWRRFRAADYGYSSAAACLWFAIAPSGKLIVYRELYTSELTAEQFALRIKEIEKNDKVSYGVLDSSLFHNRGDRGPSLAEQMNRVGVRWRPSDRSKGSRIAGKNELHRLLTVNEYTDEPGIQFFKTCTNAIAQIPVIPMDKNNPEDVDTHSEDHIYDALRYGIMSRPSNKYHAYHSTNLTKSSRHDPVDRVFGY